MSVIDFFSLAGQVVIFMRAELPAFRTRLAGG
jgi:hypothetical protein